MLEWHCCLEAAPLTIVWGKLEMLKKIVKFGLVGTLALGLVGCSNMTKEECDKANLDRV